MRGTYGFNRYGTASHHIDTDDEHDYDGKQETVGKFTIRASVMACYFIASCKQLKRW